MKTFVQNMVTALIFAVVCQTGLVVAEDVRWVSSDVEVASAADDQDALSLAPLPCSVEYLQCAAQCEPDAGCGCCWGAKRCCSVWTFDYEVRTFFNSHTSYEFGNAPGFPPEPYAPISRLDWDMDSTWHGLRVGLEKPNWCIHFNWLTPIEKNIHGLMADYDWNIDYGALGSDPDRLDRLSLSELKWNEGQMLDLGGEYKWSECFLGLPIEVWPGAGFRFQRLDMMAQGLYYVVPPLGELPGPRPAFDGVDVISFNQQYYQFYFGGQLRTQFCLAGRPVDLTFEGDYAATWGYNVDHHILRGARYTMESTDGGAMHLALVAETCIGRRASVGLRLDHMAISTTGTHRWVEPGVDMSWDDGVKVKSDQTSVAAFLRFHF